MKKIWLAGGCFWGVEAYFQQLNGVLQTRVGYGQGDIEEPTILNRQGPDEGSIEQVFTMSKKKKKKVSFLISRVCRILR